MKTLTATKTRKTVESKRALRVGEPTNGVRALVITDKKGVQCGYYLREVEVDFGKGFRFEKFEHEVEEGTERGYDVHLDAELGNSCTCPGHIYVGHCKHVDAVLTLQQLGKL